MPKVVKKESENGVMKMFVHMYMLLMIDFVVKIALNYWCVIGSVVFLQNRFCIE